MKEIAKILGYFIAVIVLGSILAPPLYWAGQWLARLGVFEFLGETDFQKFFNRAMLVAAVLLLWPTIRWLRMGRWRDLGLEKDHKWAPHLGVGFLITGGLVAAMGVAYVAFGVYRWKSDLPWGSLVKIAFSAITVALIEEALFRGAILGLFRRTLRPYLALFWTTALFAILHFLKPDEDLQITSVSWLSGFELVPQVFHQFTDPTMLLAGFTTLFTLGWVLGYATLRTRSLWMAVGLHAGVVFVKMGFSKFTKREDAFLPWIGKKLEIGLVPVGVLLLALLLVWLWTRYEERKDQVPHR